ncbi:MAG: cysteine--tRNA ligase [Armatimonadetes bacterium]|nr:cysteine--tRNA ligase [Armatimonadota bacterium]MBS1727581.1 cysteine--tRNA ligase [Armatimonadota bacterium]
MESMSEKQFRLYDSLSRKVMPLETIEPGHLRFYTCGPTVYSYAHIGNFRSFLTADLIVRTARAIGWKVTWVSNITDVGHLTDDDIADATGEDKMEKALRSKEGEQFHNIWELAEYYENAYRADWKLLNLVEPEVRPRATQHVREQILAAEDLIEKGIAYETPTGVYFSVEKFPQYGKLSGNTQESLRKGVRDVVMDENKRDQSDFAVWKKDNKHLMQWFSPYGWGFPGWHIECSVMARAYLGDTIDLHSGGEDNKFPHHECEIAQSESLTGKPFCNHWTHTAFLQVNGQKMSKSLGNFYYVRGLVDNGADPLAIRYALISGKYGKNLNFTDQGLEDAKTNIDRFRRAEASALEAIEAGTPGDDAIGGELSSLYGQTLDAMLDDVNTPEALAAALQGARAINREPLTAASARSAMEFLDKINDLLGIVRHIEPLHAVAATKEPAVDESLILEKIEARKAAKTAKDWGQADAIRKELAEQGILLTDNPDGSVTWSLA